MVEIVSIHQPSYFPWLGLLHKIKKSTKFILMDEVQLSDSAFQHRNVFLTRDGKEKKLTVNISKKSYKDKFIKDLEISNRNWRTDHVNFIKENYRNTPFFHEVMPILDEFYSIDSFKLIDVLERSMRISMDLMNIKTEVVKMSELNYDRSKRKGQLVLSLVQNSGVRTYLSGKGAEEYLNVKEFSDCGFEVFFQEFKHPQYYQCNSKDFVPGLSCLDLLFNNGIELSRSLLNEIE